MAVERVHLHIGAPKTGTTYVQGVLRQNAHRLDEQGFVLPRAGRQHRAVRRLLARRDPAADPPTGTAAGEPVDGWDRFVGALRRSDARDAIVSVESLSRAEPDAVRDMVASLEPAEVHVVYVARDLARVIPGYWQARLRNGVAPTWPELLAAVRGADPTDPLADRFWRQYDPGRALGPWLASLPAHRVRVVTVPPAGAAPQLLWQRFGRAVGLDPAGFDLSVPRTNSSLGGVEAEVLRRLTGQVADRMSGPAYGEVVKRFVARELLEPRSQSFRLVLPEAEHAWLAAPTAAATDWYRRAGVTIEGDLADLVPVVEPAARRPDDVGEEEVLALLDEVLAGAVVELARRTRVTAEP